MPSIGPDRPALPAGASFRTLYCDWLRLAPSDRDGVCGDLAKMGIPGMYSDDVEEIVEHVTRSDHGGNVFLVLSNGAFGGLFARLKEELGEA